MKTTSTALFKAGHASLHAVTRHPARTSSSRLACSMIVNQSRRLHGQQQDKTSTAAAAHTSSLSLSLSRHAHRHYSSSSLQSQPPKQGQKTEDLQKQEESPFRGDENYGAFAGPAMHTLGVFRREVLSTTIRLVFIADLLHLRNSLTNIRHTPLTIMGESNLMQFR